MKFEVGSWYFFTIESISNIPEKGDHYILKHESGRKMLLNIHYYVKYNFSIGQTIECKVDKVNCAGQVFLEPRHPIYEEGSIYYFKQLDIKNNADKSFNLVVKDYFENEIEVFAIDNPALTYNGLISLKVDKIKKGLPIFAFPIVHEIIGSRDSDLLELKVVAIVSENSEDYLSLEDSYGKIVSRLKVKHYSHYYGLKVGNTCYCHKLGYHINGLMLVEPENPWYKVGESYNFKFKSIENYINLEGEEVRSAIVLDEANIKCGITLTKEQLKLVESQSDIKCKVIGFRKGRPQLEVDLY